MKIKFGTDGVRGEAGHWPIEEDAGERIGRAAAMLAFSTGGNRVVVGRDTRPSGPALEEAVVRGVLAQGADCLRAGMTPTSAVSVAVDAQLAAAGVMITASHNAAKDNGFKLVGRGGRKLDDNGISIFEAWLEGCPEPTQIGVNHDGSGRVLDAWTQAMGRCLAGASLLRGKRIAVDLANGAALALRPWLETLDGVEWVFRGAGEGVINDGVGSEHPEGLAALVIEQRCDAGLAVDGDADRCVLVDEKGQRIAGDALTWLLCRHMGATDLVVTVMSNGALEPLLPGVRVLRTPVGDRHLREAMDAQGILLGAEESGHVLFDDFAAGDGLLTGLRTLIAAWSGHNTISAAVAPFKSLPRELSKLRVGSRPVLAGVAEVQAAIAKSTAELGEHGRVFLRYSGTEPVLRLLVEGQDAHRVAAEMVYLRDVCQVALPQAGLL
ncbi:MAG: phosphoglucosamine mutase [Rhodobacterales bacterium]|nr:phosphoglucosamine mutase [Rhodobacterales bacterium]